LFDHSVRGISSLGLENFITPISLSSGRDSPLFSSPSSLPPPPSSLPPPPETDEESVKWDDETNLLIRFNGRNITDWVPDYTSENYLRWTQIASKKPLKEILSDEYRERSSYFDAQLLARRDAWKAEQKILQVSRAQAILLSDLRVASEGVLVAEKRIEKNRHAKNKCAKGIKRSYQQYEDLKDQNDDEEDKLNEPVLKKACLTDLSAPSQQQAVGNAITNVASGRWSNATTNINSS
jgi:hypothetical protein